MATSFAIIVHDSLRAVMNGIGAKVDLIKHLPGFYKPFGNFTWKIIVLRFRLLIEKPTRLLALTRCTEILPLY
jgi:hypothetical protein